MTSQRRPWRVIGVLAVAVLTATASFVSAEESKPAKAEKKQAVKQGKKTEKQAGKPAKPAADDASIEKLLATQGGGHLLSTAPILPATSFTSPAAIPAPAPQKFAPAASP